MRYTEIAIAKPFEGAPKINLADVYGASPKKDIILRVPVTGQRPITYGAANLPTGLTLENGIITGQIECEGNYTVTLTAENDLGKAEKILTFEVKRDTVQLTPLMGFTSWNAYGFQVTQADIEHAASRMLELGLCEYGYDHVNIDSGWQGKYGGKHDAIMPNEKFPDMKGFTNKMHANGLKCGIYSTPMLRAFGCHYLSPDVPPGCTVGEPDELFSDFRTGIGKDRREKNNAEQWAEWGFDYLKYDWKPCDPYNAEMMRRELVKTDRDFGYCVTILARAEYHNYWEKYCSSYRCNGDTNGRWDRHLEVYKSYFEFMDYVNKGHFFDLDMMDTGDCTLFTKMGFDKEIGFGLTEDEQLTAYSMRAFLNSPIQVSTTFENISEFELSMYCNEEIIAINQDSAFKTARPCMMLEDGQKMIHVFKKKLSDGADAYAFFNLGETKESVKLYLDEESTIRDVWAKKDLPDADKIEITMHPHTVRIFKVK